MTTADCRNAEGSGSSWISHLVKCTGSSHLVKCTGSPQEGRGVLDIFHTPLSIAPSPPVALTREMLRFSLKVVQPPHSVTISPPPPIHSLLPRHHPAPDPPLTPSSFSLYLQPPTLGVLTPPPPLALQMVIFCSPSSMVSPALSRAWELQLLPKLEPSVPEPGRWASMRCTSLLICSGSISAPLSWPDSVPDPADSDDTIPWTSDKV